MIFVTLFVVVFLSKNALFAFESDINIIKNKLQTASNDSTKIVALTDFAQYYLYNNNDSTIKYCNIIIQLGEKSNSLMDVANANNIKAIALQLAGNYSKSVQCSKSAINLLNSIEKKYPDKELVTTNFIRFHNTLAVTHYCISDFSIAADNYHTALKYATLSNDKFREAILLSNLGSVYLDWGDLDLSLKYQEEAYKLAVSVKDTGGIVRSLFNIGSAFFTFNNYDSAYYYYQKALPLTKTINDYSALIPIYINLSSIYVARNELTKAEEMLNEANALITINDFKRSEAFYYLVSGELLLAKNDVTNAIKQLTLGYLVADSSGDLKTEQSILNKLYNAHYKLGNFKDACHYSELSKTINDTIYSEESSQRITELEIKFEVEKANMKINEMQFIQKTDKQIKSYLILVMILLIIALILLIYSFLQRRNRNKLEKELLQKEKEKLDKDIRYKSKQLTSQALMMMQKNNLISKISELLTRFSKHVPIESEHEYNSLKRQLKKSIQSEEDWDLFKHYFEEVNKDFFPSLIRINKKLTPSELKLSALVKLNFSIKETASLLNISPDSVKTARYVLRRKLGLQKGESIYDFFNHIN